MTDQHTHNASTVADLLEEIARQFEYVDHSFWKLMIDGLKHRAEVLKSQPIQPAQQAVLDLKLVIEFGMYPAPSDKQRAFKCIEALIADRASLQLQVNKLREVIGEINKHPYYDLLQPELFESGIKRLNAILDISTTVLADTAPMEQK